MINITHFGSSEAAKRYYTEQLTKGDYFAKDAEVLNPKFEGKTAALLGLEGQTVTQEQFFELLDNRLNGKPLTERTKSTRRAMTDCTFNRPKPVTLAALVDPRVDVADRESIDETMREIEQAMCVRVRKGGDDTDRLSGNMLWVKWPHNTTRPLEDGTVDPDGHTHITVINASYDPVEDKVKACQFGDIVRDKGYYQAAYHARLAEKLSQLGYGVEREGKGFRLLGIDKGTCEKFSRRTQVIEQRAAELGITDPAAKGDLGRKTRNKKTNELGSEELLKGWFARMTPKELESIHLSGTGIYKTKERSAAEAMEWAVENAFERKSVISERKLWETALVHGVGSVSVESVQGQSPDVIRKEQDGVAYVTTKKVYREELEMVAFARDGKGKFPRLANAFEISGGLSAEQQRAKERILSSRDRVTVLIGDAGAGKTHLMKDTIKAIEATKLGVCTFAQSAGASRGVLREEAGFENAETVAKLLTDQKFQRETAGKLLWVDEAGLLSTREVNGIFAVAKQNGSRVVFSGDTKQHQGVERGDGLRILLKEAGLKPATLSEIRRQKTEAYRDAVASIAKGDLEAGIKKLDSMKAIVESENRYEELAGEYIAAVTAGKTALVVTPTHKEASKVTDSVRQRLKAKGSLVGSEGELNTLYSVNLTVAEKKDPLNYQQGMVVEFQNCMGFRRGERAEITAATVDGTTVNCGGRVCQLPLEHADRFQVYQKGSMAVAAGESIRVTKNARLKNGGKEFRPNNGDVYKVAGFTDKGDLQLSNGSVIPKDFGHMAYGYTSTSHASQGKNVDKVFISMSQDSLSAANREQFYVSVSRGRESVKLYTNDKQAVLDAVKKSGARMSATELLGQRERAIDLHRVRRVYNAIKERAQQAFSQIKERTYDRKRA